MGDLVDASLPLTWDTAAAPGSRDLRLVRGASAIDSGAILPNLNDPFAVVGQPDMGAFESGQPLPDYGPRAWPRGVLFADSFESGDTSAWSVTQR